MDQATIKAKRAALVKKADVIREELQQLQDECDHPNLTRDVSFGGDAEHSVCEVCDDCGWVIYE